MPPRTEPVFVPPQGPPGMEDRPSPELYAAMGEAAIFRMLEDLYEELGRSGIRAMFPADLREASKRSAAFFVSVMGGPPLYQQRYGSPMMRRRHLPFRIDEAARAEWLACFGRVLERSQEKYGLPPQHLPGFRRFLESFSAWMVNAK